MTKLRSKQIRTMTETEKAYIAGIVDGEGWIGISLKKGSIAKTTKRGYCFRPAMTVSMTNKPLLDYICSVTGLGNIKTRCRQKPHHSIPYSWDLWSNQVRQLLEVIMPYLRLKLPQAEVVLDFCRAKTDGNRQGLSDDQWKQQELAYAKLRELNKRRKREDLCSIS